MNWGYFGGSAGRGGDSRGQDRGGDRGGDRGQDRSQDRGHNQDRGSNHGFGGSRGRDNSQRRSGTNEGYQIYVGDLDLSTNKQQLMDHFKQKYHSVIDSKIITDQATKLSKGYGFVHFSNFEESQRALSDMNGSLLRGKPIKVSQGVNRQSHSNDPRNSRGGPTNQNPNSATLNQIYGQNFASPSNQGKVGSILGGLGVQIQHPELNSQAILISPQHYGYLSTTGVQPAAGYSIQGAPSIYTNPLTGQQSLVYNYPTQAMGKPGLATDPMTGAQISTDAANMNALAQAGLAAGVYPGGAIGMMSSPLS